MGPTEKDVNIFNKLAYFISRGIGSSHMGKYLENNMVGTIQLLYHPPEISLHWWPCANGHYHKVITSSIVFENKA